MYNTLLTVFTASLLILHCDIEQNLGYVAATWPVKCKATLITYCSYHFNLQKLGRRIKSLDCKDNWNAARKAEVAQVMRIDYMSSEESEVEEDGGRKIYNVKPLSWESQELKKHKKSLDRNHMASLPLLVRQRVAPRKKGNPSMRAKPQSCPDWACQS